MSVEPRCLRCNEVVGFCLADRKWEHMHDGSDACGIPSVELWFNGARVSPRVYEAGEQIER